MTGMYKAEMASQNTKKAMEWLKKSGMVLNSSKTEAAYFSTKDRS
jgi:predicted transcriptional regulator